MGTGGDTAGEGIEEKDVSLETGQFKQILGKFSELFSWNEIIGGWILEYGLYVSNVGRGERQSGVFIRFSEQLPDISMSHSLHTLWWVDGPGAGWSIVPMTGGSLQWWRS